MGWGAKSLIAICAAVNSGTVSAFVPLSQVAVTARQRFVGARAWASTPSVIRPSGARGLRALADPSVLSSGVDPAWLHSVFTGVADAAGSMVDGAGDAGSAAGAASIGAAVAGAVAEEAANGGGGLNLNPVEFLTGVTEASITGLHGLLQGMGVPNAYGLSIIFFTLLVKFITFPLTYQQLSSTTKMQALSPKVKALQARYANNPEAASQAIQQLYQTEQVNPLAGCLPAIAQIPIFISLYRSLLNLAKENKLTESFLWIPSLEGPTFDAPPTETLDWIKTWTDGTPKLGWHDTLAYLTIPLILIVTQSVSMQIMQVPQDPNVPEDPGAATTKQVTKFLPLLIGWFSLSVPSALGLYWVLNNFISTASTVFIRQQIAAEMGQAPAKISLPFVSQEPEAMTPAATTTASTPVSVLDPAAPEVIPESNVDVIEPKGFAQVDEGADGGIEGEIVRGDGSPVAVAAAEAKPGGKSKPSKKRKKKKAGRR